MFADPNATLVPPNPVSEVPPTAALVDVLATPTRIVPESRWPAIAHMFVLDRRAGCTIENGQLEIRLTKLEDRKFDGCKLFSNGSEDLDKMLPLWTFRSSTATLIGERQVLAAGHATMVKDIENTYFLFNRTSESDARDVQNGKLSIALSDPRVARAVRIVKIENENPKQDETLLPDWSVIEIEWISKSSPPPISPIPLAKSLVFDNDDEVVGHSLGAPQLAAAVVWQRSPGTDVARLFADFGSGGSGSPVISNGVVIGVVGGSVEFTKDQKREHEDGCEIVVTPKAHAASKAHLVTLASRIQTKLLNTEGA